ncbi:MAG: hypothetical protein J5897_05935, partial [Candidatus Methanomethylophilus sp.]|nr:hypothetical protein [Methanomethylophilus sp.]
MNLVEDIIKKSELGDGDASFKLFRLYFSGKYGCKRSVYLAKKYLNIACTQSIQYLPKKYDFLLKIHDYADLIEAR